LINKIKSTTTVNLKPTELLFLNLHG